MTHHFNVSGTDRRNLAKAISRHLGIEAKYLGVPSCAYQIGSYTLSKDGALSWSDLDDADPAHLDESCSLIQALEKLGYRSEEAEFYEQQQVDIDINAENPDEPIDVSISLPRAMFDEVSLKNLEAIIQSKGTLMKRAFKTESLELKLDEEKVSFPWFSEEDPVGIAACTVFVEKIAEMAIKQTHISAKEKEVVNEKYEFRCFLLRLGLIGDEYKGVRKQLLKNLSGSAAFKCGHKKGGDVA